MPQVTFTISPDGHAIGIADCGAEFDQQFGSQETALAFFEEQGISRDRWQAEPSFEDGTLVLSIDGSEALLLQPREGMPN
jgi:hypothetical protein